jgi:hypothetical protein
MLVKMYFFGKGPGQGQIPRLLGHGPQIPIGDRRTDDTTISVEPIFEKMCSNNITSIKPGIHWE